MTRASGVGSWPGTDVRDAMRIVRDTVSLPHLPELPARGPGADIIGRGASFLIELPVDLQPSGWRLCDRPGRDLGRALGYRRQDLDELAEAFDGYQGAFKVQVCGPWTLAASLWLPRGDRLISDQGACRDLSQSLAHGIRAHVAEITRLLPGTQVLVQLDEPSLPAVLAGRLPTESGFGKLPAVELERAASVLQEVTDGLDAIVHCCAPEVPFALLRRSGIRGLSFDASQLGPKSWESVAVAAEEGATLYAGLVPTSGAFSAREAAETIRQRWEHLGLDPSLLATMVVTPGCGLGRAVDRADAVRRLAASAEAAERIGDLSVG